MIKTITLTELTSDPLTIPRTYHVLVDKISHIIEPNTNQGCCVYVGHELWVIEPADYILNKLRTTGEYND